jgi:hypothetical protein
MRELKIIKNKINSKKISTLSLILILLMTLMIAFNQSSLAQVGVPQPEKTTGYIDVSPRLIGVGQQATVNIFIYPIPTDYAYVPYYDGYRGVTVTFIKPDGTKDTFMPIDATGIYAAGQTEALGAIFFFYKPNMAGNWSVSFTMPAQNLTATPGTVIMQGCTSNTVTFTVQTEPVLAGLLNGYPWSPLPNDNVYWSSPINSNNREWSQISGDWLGASVNNPTQLLWQPYGSGPNTGHIVWKQPIRMGGLMGGDYGSLSYGSQGSAISSVIIAGKLYVNIEAADKFKCIDLATGEVLYTTDGTISYGFHIPKTAYAQTDDSPTGNVVLESSYGSNLQAVLFGGSLNCYDPFTGKLLQSISNVSSAKYVDGSPIAFGVKGTAPNFTLFRWNLTALSPFRSFSNAKPLGSSTNWQTGIEWNVALPQSIIDPLPHLPQFGFSTNPFAKLLLGVSSDASTLVVKAAPNQYWGYSSTDGTLLWNTTINYPTTANQQICLYPKNSFVILDATDSTFKCYSMKTGALEWTSDSFSDSTWATTWNAYSSATNDNNNFYAMMPDGTMRAYSLTDGHEVWRSQAFPSTEYPNNAVPYVNNMVMAGGKIYACAGYSMSYKINPVSRFGMIVCIDTATGENLWTLNGGLRPSSAANGYVIATGDYDGNVYALGKGKTETTVEIKNNVIAQGGSILIQGNVLDQSPAQAGTPAVADESMSEYMDYLHMQNATLLNTPPTPNGVTIRLAAVDPNGNVIDIGTVISNGDGMFKKTWSPSIEGEYTVYATFDGSGSYYGSYAGTALSVMNAPAATPTTQQQADTDYTMIIVGGVIAIIIVVVIATAINIMMVRKK